MKKIIAILTVVAVMLAMVPAFAMAADDEAGLSMMAADSQVTELLDNVKIKCTASKTLFGKKAKVQVKIKSGEEELAKLQELGYTIKYKYYRSGSKAAGYKLKKTDSETKFKDRSCDAGNKYYYKVKIFVYKDGKGVAKTSLKKCSAGSVKFK